MKPKIICHIMSSVDGRLLNGRWTPMFDGTPFGEAGKTYARAGRSLGTQAWMFGRNTLREGFFPDVFRHEGPTARDLATHFGRRDSERMFVVADPTGEIAYTADTVRGDNIVALLGEGFRSAISSTCAAWGSPICSRGPTAATSRSPCTGCARSSASSRSRCRAAASSTARF